MPTSPAAVRHGVSGSKARRAEKAVLATWDAARPKHRPKHLGADAIQRRKVQKFSPVLSDLVQDEVIGMAKGRTAERLSGLLTTGLDARQRAAVEAVWTDRPQPYLTAVQAVGPKGEIVFDQFPVPQHAAAALDEVRRRDVFRAGPVTRAGGRGTRWLVLRRWKTVGGSPSAARSKRSSPPTAGCSTPTCCGSNSTACGPPRPPGASATSSWALRWQRLPEMERVGAFPVKHLESIAAYGFHPLRFGVVESLNTTITAVFDVRAACAMKPCAVETEMGDGQADSIVASSGSFHGASSAAFESVKIAISERPSVSPYTIS